MQQVAFAADGTPVAHPRPTPKPLTSRPAIKPVDPIVPIRTGRLPARRAGGLPVPTRRRRGILVIISHLWVLHRVMALRGLLLALVVGLVAAGYTFRDELRTVALAGIDIATGQAVEAGFGVAEISMSGQALTREADVIRALELDDFSTTLAFDAEAARLRVEEIPSVASATVRKVYPDSIIVTIEERQPVARWRIDGATMLIDAAGRPIAPAAFENGDLMLVIGEGAGNDAVAIINLLERFPEITEEIAALSRIGDRRWDMIYYTGLRVQLPETGIVGALERLDAYHREQQLLDRDLELIDMRVPQYLAVRPTVRDES